MTADLFAVCAIRFQSGEKNPQSVQLSSDNYEAWVKEKKRKEQKNLRDELIRACVPRYLTLALRGAHKTKVPFTRVVALVGFQRKVESGVDCFGRVPEYTGFMAEWVRGFHLHLRQRGEAECQP